MIKELVNTYLATQGMKKVSGNDNDLAPLLPLLMMDLASTIWNGSIKKVESKFEMKKYKNEWEKAYHHFVSDFFRAFNQEQTDYLIDKMDEYENYIQNDLTIAKVHIMNQLSFEPLERQEILASAMLCNILSQSAQLVTMKVYKNVRGGDKENTWLKKCEVYAWQWMNAYYGTGKPHININENEVATKAIDALCHKLILFLKKVEDDEISQ